MTRDHLLGFPSVAQHAAEVATYGGRMPSSSDLYACGVPIRVRKEWDAGIAQLINDDPKLREFERGNHRLPDGTRRLTNKELSIRVRIPDAQHARMGYTVEPVGGCGYAPRAGSVVNAELVSRAVDRIADYFAEAKASADAVKPRPYILPLLTD